MAMTEREREHALLWPLRILALAAIILFLKVAKPMLVPIALAIVLTLLLAPAVDYLLRRWRIPVPVGSTLALVGFFGVITLSVLLLLPPAKQWLAGTMNGVHGMGDMLIRLRAAIPWLASALDGHGARGDPLSEKLAIQGLSITSTMLTQGVGIALTIVATVILTFLLLISERWLVVQSMVMLPRRRQRVRLLGVLRESQREVAHFLVTMGLINFAMGVVTAMAMNALGLPNAVFWGALVAVLNFIPYFGPMLLMALFLLAGVSAFDGLAMMFAPLLIFICINTVESDVLSPWIMGRRLRLNPLAIIFTVLLLGWLWGVIGAFLTVPVLIIARSVARHHRRMRLFVFIARAGEAPCSMRSLLDSGEKCNRSLLLHYRSQARLNGRR